MTKKECFKDCLKYPKDTIVLSVINFSISLVSFKNLLGFFKMGSLESWVLLSLAILGVGVSVSIFKFKNWSFGLFHAFAALVSLTALTQLYIRPSQMNYYTLLAVVSYSALGSMVLHRYIHSACFNPKNFFMHKLPIALKAFLKVNNQPQAVNILDISNTGCFLETDLDLKLGESCHLAIDLGDYSLRANCQIMRESSLPRGYGLMFTGIDHRKFASSEIAIKELYETMKHMQAKNQNQGISA